MRRLGRALAELGELGVLVLIGFGLGSVLAVLVIVEHRL